MTVFCAFVRDVEDALKCDHFIIKRGFWCCWRKCVVVIESTSLLAVLSCAQLKEKIDIP